MRASYFFSRSVRFIPAKYAKKYAIALINAYEIALIIAYFLAYFAGRSAAFLSPLRHVLHV